MSAPKAVEIPLGRRRTRPERIAYFQGRLESAQANLAALRDEVKKRRMMIGILRKALAMTRRLP